jgi:hypothetical protein
MSKHTNLDLKEQLPSILSISCNIQHLAQQQSQRKLQWSILQKDVMATSSGQIRQIEKAVNPMTSSNKWRHERFQGRKSPSAQGITPLKNQKEACSGETTRNALLKQFKRKRNGLRMMLREQPLRQERELMTRRQRFSNSRKIWRVLK